MPVRAEHSYAPRKLFREVKWEVMKVLFLNELLNSAIVFFLLNIVLTLFNMSFLWSVGVAVLFLVIRLSRGWRKSVIRKLERGNPEVDEILRTAYEHQDVSSLMVQGLVYDLQKRLSTVSAGVLLSWRRVATKLIVVFLLAFTPVIIISFTPQLIQQNPFRDFSFEDFFSDPSPDAIGQLLGVSLNESDDIYGDANLARLGDDRIEITVVSGGNTVDFSTVSDPEDRAFRYNEYPVEPDVQEAGTASSVAYSEDDVALIAEYSCRTKGACG